ncbi:NUDIX hydrolase [Luteococcus sanguinis]|uniref:NUDIX domain-containing protein n=1 Tax=Luteococcus sanguinis TaxID=174038 RepID=A0ABW1WZY8_9ACTN
MSRKTRLVAAGAVVLRTHNGTQQVLLVRRPKYKDWSLPKGKPEWDEDLPATAVREVREETGVVVRLALPLGTTQYSVKGDKKVVHWWLGRQVIAHKHAKDSEVSKVRWMDVDEARRKMTYRDEREIVTAALAAPPTGTLLIVRHGKAMLRRHWSGSDAKRPLSTRGRRQSKRLVPMLAAFGVEELLSSTSTRCLQTLQPASEKLDLPLCGVALLSEEEADGHEDRVVALVAAWRQRVGEQATALAVCGHRPVLPAMRAGAGVQDKAMLTAETLVIHVTADGRVVAHETHKSAF